MADWGKVYGSLHTSLKFVSASKGARSLWLMAFSWCVAHETDGHVPAAMLRVLDGTKADAAALVTVGLWDVVDDGWVFHGWAARNRTAEDADRQREAWREKKRRQRTNARVESPDVSPGDNRGDSTGESPESPATEERRGEESKRPATQAPAPDPEPHPEFGVPALLASQGLTESERRDFLASLKRSGVRNAVTLVNALHREGKLAGRIQEWREDRNADAAAATKPKVKGAVPSHLAWMVDRA